MHQYILLQTFPYECPWILGVFNDLDEILEYLLKIEQENDEKYDECDKKFNWTYRIEEWNKNILIRTYKYNNVTSLLE